MTVALSGDGGDENFGGYRRYRHHMAEERLRGALPLSVRRAAVRGCWGAPTRRRTGRRGSFAPNRPSRRSGAIRWPRISTACRSCATTCAAGSSARSFKAQLGGYNAIEVFRRHAAMAGTDDPLALVQYLDLKTYLVGDINTKVDRASMAHSLEVREPLMDHPLVEWLASLPSSFKVRERGRQVAAQEGDGAASAGGRAVPTRRWGSPCRLPAGSAARSAARARRAAGRATRREPASLTGITSRHLVDQHQSGRRDYSSPLWTLLMFDAFLRNVVERQAGAGFLYKAA